MAELLRTTSRPGFPTDYLLARLPHRQTRRRTACPTGASEEPWREWERELNWLHSQLETRLRRELAPALLFFELPHLLAALRFAAVGDRLGVAESLERSRLAAPFRTILGPTAPPFPEKLRRLGLYLGGFDPALAGLAKAWRERGQAGLEQTLVAGLEAAARREQPTGPVGDFLARLFDHQGLVRLALAEHRQPPPREPGPRRLRRLRLALAARHPETAADPAALDRLLLRSLAREGRRRSRCGGAHEQLLDYLWIGYLAARDCGVRGRVELLGKSRVEEETIL